MSIKIAQTVFSPWLTPVRVVSSANIDGVYSNGLQNDGIGATLIIAASSLTIDDTLLEVSDRLLLSAQSSGNENGIYIVINISTMVVLQRASDQQSLEQYHVGQYVSVASGTTGEAKIYTLVEPLPAHLGIDNLTWAATASGGGGGVVLPTVANYIAHFSDAAGTISSDADNVTNAGNISAGLSGTSGSVSSFPPTPASGSLILQSIDNTGDYAVTISNFSVTQDVAYSLADANAFSELTILSQLDAFPLVAGNFPVNSPIKGIFFDSGLSVSDVETLINNGLVPRDYSVSSSDLALGGQLIVFPIGEIHEYVVRDILANKAVQDFSGGDRDIILTDGATVYTTLSAAFLQASSNAGWGSTNVPYPSVACNTTTSIFAGLYFIYSGGTTDYTNGQIYFTLSTQKVF